MRARTHVRFIIERLDRNDFGEVFEKGQQIALRGVFGQPSHEDCRFQRVVGPDRSMKWARGPPA